MLRSMTGFASLDRQVGDTLLAWQIRAVNHRNLELHFHLPDGWDEVESQAVRRVRERLSRGRLDLNLVLAANGQRKGRLELDQGLLNNLLSLERQVIDIAGNRSLFSMDALFAWPGLLRETHKTELPADEKEGLVQGALGLLDETLAELVVMRSREGEGILAVLTPLLDELVALVNQTSIHLPRIREQFAHRFRDKVRELSEPGSDESRLSQELVFLLNRMDISEERDRLLLHVQEFRESMANDSVVGRRLDFLCQELNREANTLCSKAQDGTISRMGIELKVIIEKLREQVQNLE